jgi:hypothetical protein
MFAHVVVGDMAVLPCIEDVQAWGTADQGHQNEVSIITNNHWQARTRQRQQNHHQHK